MKTYELFTEGSIQMLKVTLQDETILWVPLDPANSDYQEYLASLEEDEV
jgi:hypothetical protein